MAKVLISFLGTGPTDRLQSYKTTKYRFEQSDNEYECSFLASAIAKEYNVDKIFLIGTVKSMWDEVYNYFGNKNGIFDNNIWETIAEYRLNDKVNSKSELELPCQKEIEAALGKGSRAVLIKYGLNSEEIRENSDIILGLEQYLTSNDEVIVDITHSFRSLPMYVMNLLIFLKDVKHINISHICYGMLEVSAELGYSPVVEMNELLTINSWISGAYSMLEFGNAYKIADLVESIDKGLSTRLREFSDVKNLNHLTLLEHQCQKLQAIRDNHNLPKIVQMVVTPVIREFLNQVQPRRTDNEQYSHSTFQYRLACWHNNKCNYLAAYISLTESILSRACEELNVDPIIHENRDYVKGVWWENNVSRKCAQMYNDVSKIRHALAHSIDVKIQQPQERKLNKFKKPTNAREMIESLCYYLNQYRIKFRQ